VRICGDNWSAKPPSDAGSTVRTVRLAVAEVFAVPANPCPDDDASLNADSSRYASNVTAADGRL
jgi:hypothetical protein